MAQSAGTITAEIRVALDQLQTDITKANAMFKQIPGTVQPAAQKTTTAVQRMQAGVTKGFATMAKTGIGKMALMAQGMQKAIMAAPVVGAIMMLVGLLVKAGKAVNDFLTRGVETYQAHQQELAKMNAVLNATGTAAWTSARQLTAQAEALANSTRFAQNEIMSMQTQLLTFRAVTGEVFNKTTKAITDMATAMGKDLGTATGYVGRALDNPIYGMRVLSRQGVIFTDTQRNMIEAMVEAGDTAGAQRIILDELGNTFGNAAQEVAAITAAQDRLNNAEERLERARGERNAARVNRRANRMAARREERAEAIELQNAIRAANARISDGYQQQYEELERLRLKLADVSDEWDRTLIEDRIVKLEMETNLLQTVDQLVLAENHLNVLMATGERMTGAAVRDAQARVEALQAEVNEIENTMAIADERAAQNMAAHQQELNELAQVEEMQIRLKEIEMQRVTTLYEIERAFRAGLITAEQATNQKMAAYAAEANAINGLITLTNRLALSTDAARASQADLFGRLESGLVMAAGQVQAGAQQVRNLGRITGQEFFDQVYTFRAQMNRAITFYNNELAQGRMDEMEHQVAVLRVREQAVNSADNLAKRYGVIWEQNRGAANLLIATRQLIEETDEHIKQMANAEELAKKQEAAYERLSRNLIDLTRQYQIMEADAYTARRLQREWAWEAIRDTEEYILLLESANEEHQKLAENIERQFHAVQQAQAVNELNEMLTNYQIRLDIMGMTAQEVIELQRTIALETARAFQGVDGYEYLIAQINAYYDELQRLAQSNPWQRLAAEVQQYGSQVSQIISVAGALYAQSIRNETAMLRRELRERHRMLQDALAAELQERLFAKGFVEAATKAQHKEELRLAKKSGDQQRIFLAHSNMERFLIEEEFGQKKTELEEKLRQEEAQLAYRAANAQWRMQVLNSKVAASMAILSGFMTQPFIPAGLAAGALATGLSAAQVALVKMNRPKLETFAQGGIVQGSNFRGDINLVRANADEMFLTPRQQKNLFDMANTGENGNFGEQKNKIITVEIPIYLDRRVITKAVVEDINNRRVLIKANSVI